MATSIDDVLGEFLGAPAPSAGPPSKYVQVGQTSRAKKASMASGYRAGAGNSTGLLNETLTDEMLLGSHGGDEAFAETEGRASYISDASDTRSPWEATKDFSVDVVNGAMQGALGIGGAAAGIVNADAGTAVSDFSNDVNDFWQGTQSDALTGRRAASAVRSDITGEHNAALEQQEIADGDSPLMAGLRRIGRDMTRAATNGDELTIKSGISSGIGSLAVGGWAGKGLKAIGFGRAAMPTAIGALEGGGAYTQTVNEVMAMPHEQLLAGSPEYVQMINEGMDQTKAKMRIANQAGLEAGAIQAPIGVATGALVSKFEASPFSVPSVRTAAGNIIRETLEEGIQSGAGQASSNYAIKDNADDNRDLIEGVGQAAGEGAIYGAGTAGAVQAPGLPGAFAMDVARGAKAVGKSAYGKLEARAKEFGRQIDENNPLSMTNLRAAFDEVKGKVTDPNYAANLRASVAAKAANPTEAKTAAEYVDRITTQMSMDPVTEAELETSPRIKELVGNSTDRFDALQRASDLIEDDDASDQDKLDAGVYILGQIQKHEQLFNSDVAEAITLMDDDDDTLPELRKLEGILNNIGQNPKVAGAVQKAMGLADTITPDQVDKDLATLRTAAKIAELAPERSKLDVVDRVLFHADNGDVELTPESRQSIEATQALLQSEKEHTDDNAAIMASGAKVATNPNIVSQEIKRKSGDKEAGFLSGRDHQTGILAAWHAGNKTEAKIRLENLRKFAQHLQNKVGALNESLAKGDGFTPFKYQSLIAGSKKFIQSEEGVWVNPEVPKSVALAQQIASDAKAITNLHNKLADIFKELGVEQIPDATLDETLKGDARAVAIKSRQDGWRASRTGGSMSVEQPTRQPDPEAVVSDEAPSDALQPAEAVAEPRASAREISGPPEIESAPKVEEKVVEDTPVAEPAKAEPARPETKPEPVVVEEPVVDNGVSERTSLLDRLHSVPGKVKNWFVESFNLKDDISRLANDPEPDATVVEALKSQASWVAMAGERAKGILTPALSKAYGEFIDQFAQPIAEILEARLQKNLAGEKIAGGQTFAEAMTDGPAKGRSPNLFQKGKTLNTVVKNEDGSFEYDAALMKTAILASLQWVLTTEQGTKVRRDDETIAKLLGIPESMVTSKERDFFNQGIPLSVVQRELGTMIRQFWGAKAKPTALTGNVDGIIGSWAGEMLQALGSADPTVKGSQAGVGLFTTRKEDFNGKTYIQVDMIKNDLVDALQELPNAIEQAVLTDPAEVFHFGSPPANKPRSQMRNKQAPLTRQQKQMVENEQAVSHRLNVPMVQVYTSLGEENLVNLFGGGAFDEDTTNVNHAKRLKSQNSTVTSALRTLRSMLDQMSNQKLDPSETDIFYEYEISKVARLHMQGANNPQANKLMREVILPTFSEIDLTDPAKLDVFKLAMGQHWGLDVDKLTNDVIVGQVDQMAAGDLAEVLDMLAKWEAEKPMFTADQVSLLKKHFNTPAALHAAVEFARYLNADEAGRKAFNTSTYIEADGKTDGPINAMMHMASGNFTAAWVQIMEKGGLYIGSRSFTDAGEAMSLNSYIAKGGEAEVDLYGVAKRATRINLAENYSKADPLTKTQIGHLINLMDELGIGIEIQGDSFELTRKLLKNPVTIKIYGSGLGGIAGNIAQEIQTAIYEKMSDPKVSLTTEGRAALDALTSTLVKISKKDDKPFVLNTRPAMPEKISRKDYTFTSDQSKTLTDNVLDLLVSGPMKQGIGAAIGETDANVALLQKAVQIQSIFLARAFNEAVHAKLDSKEAANDGLTYAEVDEIWSQVKHLSPMIDTGWQTFTTAASGKADLRNQAKVERIQAENRAEIAAAKLEGRDPKLERLPDDVDFGRDFDERYRTPGTIEAPMNAGVRGIPMMIIGPGDGIMIQNFSTDQSRPNTLLVFDGINMGLNDIQAGSELVNKSVLEGWLNGNPLGDVSRSYNDFLSSIDTQGDISGTMMQELAEAVYGPGKVAAEATAGDIGFFIEQLGSDIKSASAKLQARKNVLKKVRLSVDHMATAMRPYVAEGIELSGTPEQIAEQLNEMLAAEEAKLGVARPAETDENIRDELANMGQLNEVSGATTANILELRNAVRDMSIPADQKKLIDETIKVLIDSDYQITFGTLAQIQADRIDAGLSPLNRSDVGNIYGFQIPSEKRIYLVATSSETLAHELIHAATIDKLVAYYSDPTNLSQEQRDAATRIEALMFEWIAVEPYSLGSPQVQATHAKMVRQVEGYLSKDDKASAVNEFMAWTLTNQDLATAAKNKTVFGKIAQLTADVIAAIKQLVWGRAKAPAVGDDLYSNLSFNTQVLMFTPPTLPQQMEQMLLFHSTGQDDRLATIRENLLRKVMMFVDNRPGDPTNIKNDRFNTALANASDVAKSFRDHGWKMTPAQNSTFETIVAVLATDIELDANSLARAQQIYETVTEVLTEEMLMDDPDSTDTYARIEAQERLNSLLGTYVTRKDAKDRTQLLPAFLALATVHPDFRATLERMKLDKREPNKDGTLDAALENFGNNRMDSLLKASSGQGKAENLSEAIDALTDHMTKLVADEQNLIQQGWTASGNVVDIANQKVIDGMKWATTAGYDALDKLSKSTDKEWVRKSAELGKMITSIIDEDKAEIVAAGITSAINNTPEIPRFFQEMWTEILGRTQSNALIYDMVKRVRSYVQQTRQQFREHQPKVIIKAFSRVLEKTEWAALTKGVARMDLAALSSSFTVPQIVKMLTDPRAVKQLQKKLESELEAIDQANWPVRQAKARELAKFMNEGTTSSGNLLRNAYAVANLFGEIPNGIRSKLEITPDMVEKIDQLVSLYAYSSLDTDTKTAVEKLASEETDGMVYTLSFLVGQRKTELTKSSNGGRAESNHYKGHVPIENDSGSSLVVADDIDGSRMQKMGFTRVGDYAGSAAERGANKRGYYFTTVMGRAAFKQGIMQNVRKTVFGIDPHTGYTMDASTAGVIEDPNEVAQIQRLQKANARSKEPLLPVYDGRGNLVAYERSIDPVQQARLKINDNLAEILGIWRGRQVEEHYADQFNQQLVSNLSAKWQEEKRTKAGEYIDLFSSTAQKDKVIRDAVRLFTPEARAMIKNAFPDGTFMVRKDMVNDAIGYRAVSVGDSWTGVSRLPDEMQKVMQNVAMGIFGKEAFRKIVRAEKLYQTFVSDAKVTIVVKSVIVPVANIMSNVVHLAARGVPLLSIVRGFPKKAAEIDAFLKGRLRRIQLESDLRVAEGNNDKARVQQIKVQVKSILDANRRLSIWPLIEAGELAAISDIGISHEDTLLSEGKLTEYLDALTNKLPPELRTAAKYGMVSRDTALFKGMQKAVEYGDFLAKAILFDNLVQKQGKTSAYALTRITEEFVNYDRQPGRERGYLEDMGLIWFWNFKLRSMKVAMSVLRNNPVHAALTALLPLPDSIGSPLTDNMASVVFDGRLGYSMGVDQLLHAHALNPWVNMVS